jgi:hypothetical protein
LSGAQPRARAPRIAPPGLGETSQAYLLVTAARAVLAAFRGDVDAGTLRPLQHAPLRLLEAALDQFHEPLRAVDNDQAAS